MKSEAMKNIVVGTAGHIDHGKTALVRALTGTDTDRLKEEKERGISIDLGFAHLDLAEDVRLAFIDVPGHEKFIKNMLAGAGGIDLVLLIIAADESIKPQTREHFDICRLLNLKRGLVVLTKTDLVDGEIAELARLEVEDFVRGSFLEDAPVVPVSSATGAGLPRLREELLRIARAIPGKDASRYFRLPIDRAFSMRGFGAVVTGTLASGAVRVEQEVEVHPAGRRVRVRGIQVHGAGVDRATAGQRTALNLSGIDTAGLARGMVLSEVGKFSTTRQIDTAFDLLPSAHPLKHRAPVHFHAGTSEVEAEARLIGTTQPLPPGHRAYVRFLLREPLLLLPGDRFIARMFSPVATIGGGVVLDIAAPKRAPAARLETLERATPAEKISLYVRESGHGMEISALIARTGLRADEIQKAAETAGLAILNQPRDWLIDAAWFHERSETLHQTLKDFHRKKPLLPGMSKEELRTRLIPNAPEFVLDALLAQSKTVVAQGDLLRLASHRVALKSDEEHAASKIEEAFRKAGLAVPSTTEALARCGVEPDRAKSLLQMLLRDRRLVRITEDLVFHVSAIGQLRELLAARKGARFGVAEFKDWTGISRKYAIPLLEFLDREHVTKREGDARLVL